MNRTYLVALSLTASAVSAQPRIDYHQHLFNPAVVRMAQAAGRAYAGVSTASDIVAMLDSAGVQRALVLSVAYQYGNPNRPQVDSEYAKVKAENDWTSRQVAPYPDRLRGFC